MSSKRPDKSIDISSACFDGLMAPSEQEALVEKIQERIDEIGLQLKNNRTLDIALGFGLPIDPEVTFGENGEVILTLHDVCTEKTPSMSAAYMLHIQGILGMLMGVCIASETSANTQDATTIPPMTYVSQPVKRHRDRDGLPKIVENSMTFTDIDQLVNALNKLAMEPDQLIEREANRAIWM